MAETGLKGKYPVLAMCEIELGTRCVVEGLSHDDPISLAYYNACNEQEAVVVGLNEGSVNIRMNTGPWKDKVVDRVKTKFLFFQGPFKMVMAAEEHY